MLFEIINARLMSILAVCKRIQFINIGNYLAVISVARNCSFRRNICSESIIRRQNSDYVLKKK